MLVDVMIKKFCFIPENNTILTKIVKDSVLVCSAVIGNCNRFHEIQPFAIEYNISVYAKDIIISNYGDNTET